MRYTIPPLGYMRDNIGLNKCEIMVTESENEFRLGQPFLKQYVTSFNYETSEVSFGINVSGLDGTSV